MKRAFLLMFVSALLATLGFAQTPNAGSNTDQANVKGCLGGSDGNYTVAEDGTRQIFKITTSSVDLKPHLGHEVKLIGHKASGAVSSGAADNSFAVTELNMISEHCAVAAAARRGDGQSVFGACQHTRCGRCCTRGDGQSVLRARLSAHPAADAAAPAATVSPSSAPVSTPPADAAAPAATVSPSSAPVSTPPADAAAPAATVSPSSAPVSTPPADAAAPAATVSPSSAPVSTPPADTVHPTRLSAHPRRSATKAAAATAPAAAVNPSSETVSPSAADTAIANAATPAATASTPAAAATTTTTPTVTHRRGSLSLLISFVVLVIVLGTLVPLLSRWRKRKMLERTGAPNLSFTKEASGKEASSDQDKPAPRKVA